MPGAGAFSGSSGISTTTTSLFDVTGVALFATTSAVLSAAFSELAAGGEDTVPEVVHAAMLAQVTTANQCRIMLSPSVIDGHMRHARLVSMAGLVYKEYSDSVTVPNVKSIAIRAQLPAGDTIRYSI